MFKEKELRHADILRLLKEHGSIQVTTLASILNVSHVTIRKDLTELEQAKKLYRSHGKAIIMEPFAANRPVNEKEKHAPQQKIAIGREASKLITPNDSILIASGTTLHALARNLKADGKLTAITASIEVSAILLADSNIEIIQLGGILRHSSRSVVGNYAEKILENFACSKFFIGVDGIDCEFGLTTTDLREAYLNQCMMRAAQKTIVLADSSKFGRRGFSKICNMDDVDLIITDDGIPQNYIDQIQNLGIELCIVPSKIK